MDYTYTCLIKRTPLLAGVSLLSGLLKPGSSPASALSVTTERGQERPLDQPLRAEKTGEFNYHRNPGHSVLQENFCCSRWLFLHPPEICGLCRHRLHLVRSNGSGIPRDPF